MANPFEQAYPRIAQWIATQGWIEMGEDENSDSLVRCLDEGGLVWESSGEQNSIDATLRALEEELVDQMDESD
jgi:hypothetical protein